MSEGIKESFCPLLWRSNGGTVDARSRPISPNHTGQLKVVSDEDIAVEDKLTEQAEEENRQYVSRYARGLCTRPYDCTECPLLQQEISFHPPELVNWVCPSCLREVCREAKEKDLKLSMPGFFQEGVCTYVRCSRPSRKEEADGLPGIASNQQVDTPPGFSRFLQLVLGPINQ